MARSAAEAPKFDRRVCVDNSLQVRPAELLDVARRHAHGKNRLGFGTAAMAWRVWRGLDSLRDANHHPSDPQFDLAEANIGLTASTSHLKLVEAKVGRVQLTRTERRRLEKQHQTAEAIGEITRRTDVNRDMHAVDRAEILPESLITLSADPAEREGQVRGDKAFLVFFEMFYPNARELGRFEERLSEAGTDTVKIGPYLDHMSSCPGQPDEARTDAAGIKNAYDIYRVGVDITKLPEFGAGTKDFRREPLSGLEYEKIIANNIASVRSREADDRHRMVGTQLQVIGSWMRLAAPVLRAEGEFIEETGMSRQVLRDFAEARDEVDGISKAAAEKYASAALIVIELHTKGVIDAQSEHFQAFFNEVFPKYPLQFRGILRREINRLTEERAKQQAEIAEPVAVG